MEKFEKAKLITSVVWNSIWLVGGIFFWIVGLVGFIENTEFFMWLVWGILCTPFIITYIIKYATKSSKDSARSGANHYTISSSGYISNHAFGGAVFGFIVGLVLGVLAGPIALPINAVNKSTELIKNIKYLKDSKE